MQTYRILFFGDSLTAGYGLNNASVESFPALIQQKINAERLPFEAVNAGLSGDTTGGGLSRLGYWLSGRVDMFVLELGINDFMRGVSPATMSHNLQSIIDKVKTKFPEAPIALMGMEVPDQVQGLVSPDFRHLFRKLADKNNLTFVPFFLAGVAGLTHLNLMDGLHPNAQGYRVIADTVWPVLKPLMMEKVHRPVGT